MSPRPRSRSPRATWAGPRGARRGARAFDAHGDRENAAHARYLEVRRLLLIGRIDEAERTLAGSTPRPSPRRGPPVVTHSVDEAIFLSDRIIVMGVPGRVVGEFAVELPRPRNAYDWRSAPEYTHIRGEVWRLLEQELPQSEALSAA